MSTARAKGTVYHCPVCGAEVTILSDPKGEFVPRCCNVDMVPKRQRAEFYVCPRCGAELAVVRQGSGEFLPQCCNVDMIRQAA